VHKSTWHYLLRERPWHTITAIAATCVLEGAAWWVVSTYAIELTSSTILVFFGVPLLIPLIGIWRVSLRMEQLFFTELARSLGFTYTPSAPLSTVSGSLFARGYDRELSHILTGTYRSLPFRLYNYTFTVQSGKNGVPVLYVVGEIDVQAPLPSILVRPHAALPLFDVAVIKELPGMKALKAEGDFNKHFDVFVAEGAEIEALEVLQPDTMALLMTQYKDFGIESAGTKTYVFKPGLLIENRTDILALLKLIDQLYDKLIPELGRIRTTP